MTTVRRLAVAAGAVALAAIALGAAGLFSVGHSGGSGVSSPEVRRGAAHTDSAHAPPAAMRSLVVWARREPAPSLPGATMRALRVSGAVPGATVVGTVLSDDDCAADAAGISHCINKVRLANGAVLTVRHPHRMADVPCMTPGERLMVRAA